MNGYKQRAMKRLFGDALPDARISAPVLHVESAAKNILRVCKDIVAFEKAGRFDYIIDRCEDIEEFSQKALKYGKRIEAAAKSKGK